MTHLNHDDDPAEGQSSTMNRSHLRWQVHGSSPWMDVHISDVEQPDGRRVEYHWLGLRHVAVLALVKDCEQVLMMWRHRFVTDTWAWELPMGLVEDGETPEQAAAREAEEETGWRPGSLKPLIYAQPWSARFVDGANPSCHRGSAAAGTIESAQPPR